MITPQTPTQTLTRLNLFHSLRSKLILVFLTISVIPLITVGLVNYSQVQNALQNEVVNKLIAVRDMQAKRIEKYFHDCLNDIQLLSQNPFTIAAVRAFEEVIHADMETLQMDETRIFKNHDYSQYLNKPATTDANDGNAYSAVHAKYHPLFKAYQEIYGYYDIFLVEPHNGNIVYTVKKEKDFGTSLKTGPYAGTNLGHLFQSSFATTDPDLTHLEDFADYEPSQQPASFVASPIFDKTELVGILIFQLPTEQINAIMQEHAGLGETGETLLVSSDDFLLRSNSRFYEQPTLLKIKMDNEATHASALGKTGVKEIIDYRGELTLIAHTPLNIHDVQWSLNVKIDKVKAFSAVSQILTWGLSILCITILIIIIMAIFFSESLAKPIQAMTNIAHQLANGQMNLTIEVKNQDEMGVMANAFRQMIVNLQSMIEDTVQISQGLAQGNLRVTPQIEYKGDFLKLKNALETTLTNLNQLIENIIENAVKLAEGRLYSIPENKYPGDFIQIHHALESAAARLTETTTENTMQNWLKTGQTQLNDLMRGEQDTVMLAKNIITCLTTYVEAQVGLFYHFKQPDSSNQQPYLQIIASYAYATNDNLPNKFLLGEGLVGQAALECKAISFTQTTEECLLLIRSGLAGALPQYMLLLPFSYEDTVKGVIEIGSTRVLTDIQRDFLEQALPKIGIAINTAESRAQMQILLETSQQQAKELQNQQAELQQKQQELQQTNEELQSQSEELQTQSEELQAQQEELRQINEELEERTQALEQQKAQIQHKNIALEQSQAEMETAKVAIETKAKELELASQYKSEFLANMSHELRTPLNSMLILTQLLADNKPGNLEDKQVEYARTIHNAGTDLLTLINEILDLSKVEAGKIEIHLEEMSLANFVETLEQKFHPVAQKKGLAFHIVIADDMPTVLHTDGQRFQQIINNLLSNAFKFTEIGEVKLIMRRLSDNSSLIPFIQKELPLGAREDFLTISVTDTGIGIPKEKQQVIFEAFQQADGSTNRRYGGTGLGLSISRQLARLLGGELTLESEENKGSLFTLFLPTAPAQIETKVFAQTKTKPPVEVEVVSDSSTEIERFESNNSIMDDRNCLQPNDKMILIVEDERKFSNIMMELARERNFKCLLAEDGKTGLKLAAEYQPHAIILDVGLPQLDGLSVMDRLKDNPNTRHIPVHFISASEQDMEAKKMGAIGYLLKPVSLDKLGEAFKKIEQFLTKTVKNLLVVADNNKAHQQQMINLVENEKVQTTPAITIANAWQHIKTVSYDCIIIDIDVEQGMGVKLCEQLYEEMSQIPIILYASRDLTLKEEQILQHCSDNLTVKAVNSPARLLDEATLFLHQVEAHLPVDKRKMLQMVHDKQAILKQKKVLIVDDDIRNSFALTTFLEEQDMEVILSENGKEALNLLDQHPNISIILMDIMMPEMDGYEAMQEIRKQPRFRKLPIIALTAKAMKGDKAKCIEAGANDYLSKPVDTDKLISLMRVWLYQ